MLPAAASSQEDAVDAMADAGGGSEVVQEEHHPPPGGDVAATTIGIELQEETLRPKYTHSLPAQKTGLWKQPDTRRASRSVGTKSPETGSVRQGQVTSSQRSPLLQKPAAATAAASEPTFPVHQATSESSGGGLKKVKGHSRSPHSSKKRSKKHGRKRVGWRRNSTSEMGDPWGRGRHTETRRRASTRVKIDPPSPKEAPLVVIPQTIDFLKDTLLEQRERGPSFGSQRSSTVHSIDSDFDSVAMFSELNTKFVENVEDVDQGMPIDERIAIAVMYVQDMREERAGFSFEMKEGTQRDAFQLQQHIGFFAAFVLLSAFHCGMAVAQLNNTAETEWLYLEIIPLCFYLLDFGLQLHYGLPTKRFHVRWDQLCAARPNAGATGMVAAPAGDEHGRGGYDTDGDTETDPGTGSETDEDDAGPSRQVRSRQEEAMLAMPQENDDETEDGEVAVETVVSEDLLETSGRPRASRMRSIVHSPPAATPVVPASGPGTGVTSDADVDVDVDVVIDAHAGTLPSNDVDSSSQEELLAGPGAPPATLDMPALDSPDNLTPRSVASDRAPHDTIAVAPVPPAQGPVDDPLSVPDTYPDPDPYPKSVPGEPAAPAPAPAPAPASAPASAPAPGPEVAPAALSHGSSSSQSQLSRTGNDQGNHNSNNELLQRSWLSPVFVIVRWMDCILLLWLWCEWIAAAGSDADSWVRKYRLSHIFLSVRIMLRWERLFEKLWAVWKALVRSIPFVLTFILFIVMFSVMAIGLFGSILADYGVDQGEELQEGLADGTFGSIGDAMLSFYVLSTSENYPEVMTLAYNVDSPRNVVLFTVFYIVVGVGFFSALVPTVAVAYQDHRTELMRKNLYAQLDTFAHIFKLLSTSYPSKPLSSRRGTVDEVVEQQADDFDDAIDAAYRNVPRAGVATGLDTAVTGALPSPLLRAVAPPAAAASVADSNSMSSVQRHLNLVENTLPQTNRRGSARMEVEALLEDSPTNNQPEDAKAAVAEPAAAVGDERNKEQRQRDKDQARDSRNQSSNEEQESQRAPTAPAMMVSVEEEERKEVATRGSPASVAQAEKKDDEKKDQGVDTQLDDVDVDAEAHADVSAGAGTGPHTRPLYAPDGGGVGVEEEKTAVDQSPQPQLQQDHLLPPGDDTAVLSRRKVVGPPPLDLLRRSSSASQQSQVQGNNNSSTGIPKKVWMEFWAALHQGEPDQAGMEHYGDKLFEEMEQKGTKDDHLDSLEFFYLHQHILHGWTAPQDTAAQDSNIFYRTMQFSRDTVSKAAWVLEMVPFQAVVLVHGLVLFLEAAYTRDRDWRGPLNVVEQLCFAAMCLEVLVCRVITAASSTAGVSKLKAVHKAIAEFWSRLDFSTVLCSFIARLILFIVSGAGSYNCRHHILINTTEFCAPHRVINLFVVTRALLMLRLLGGFQHQVILRVRAFLFFLWRSSKRLVSLLGVIVCIFYTFSMAGIFFMNIQVDTSVLEPEDTPESFQLFDTFPHALMTLFQVLTSSNWQFLMYFYRDQRSGVVWQVLTSLYFCIFFFLINLVLLNIVLASLWDLLKELDQELKKHNDNRNTAGAGSVSRRESLSDVRSAQGPRVSMSYSSVAPVGGMGSAAPTPDVDQGFQGLPTAWRPTDDGNFNGGGTAVLAQSVPAPTDDGQIAHETMSAGQFMSLPTGSLRGVGRRSQAMMPADAQGDFLAHYQQIVASNTNVAMAAVGAAASAAAGRGQGFSRAQTMRPMAVALEPVGPYSTRAHQTGSTESSRTPGSDGATPAGIRRVQTMVPSQTRRTAGSVPGPGQTGNNGGVNTSEPTRRARRSVQ